MDLTKRSTFDLQEMLKVPMSPSQRRAVQAELDRRSRPANVTANLDGAATPLTPDPEVDPRRKAYEDAHIADGWTPEQVEALARREAKLPDAFNPARWDDPQARQNSRRAAVEQRQNEARADAFSRELGQAYGHFDPPPMPTEFVRGPYGIPNFAPGSMTMVDGVEVPEYDLGDFKGRYFLGDVRRAKEAHAEEMRPWGTMGVPGPQGDNGAPAAGPPTWDTVAEGRAYYTRPVDPDTGKLLPSPADRARWARGEAPVYDEDSGEIVYRMIAPPEDPKPDGRAPAAGLTPPRPVARAWDAPPPEPPPPPPPAWHEQLGLRVAPYHERQNRSSLGVDLQDGSTARVPTHERKMANGPLGPVEILVPTQATRLAWNRRNLDDKVRRIAAATGVPVPMALPREHQQAMALQNAGAAPAGGDAPAAGNAPPDGMTIDDLRVMAEKNPALLSRWYLDQKAAEKGERKRRYREKVMLAGGSQNLTSRNQGFLHTLVDMPAAERQRAMEQMMPMDPNRAMVEANNARNAMHMLNNIGGAAGLRQILGGNDPLDRDFKQVQLDALKQQIKDAQDTAGMKEQAVKGEANRKETEDRAAMMAWLEDHVKSNYANPKGILNYPNRHIWGLWDTTDYTVDEQNATRTAFRARYPHVSDDELEDMMRAIMSTRNSH